MNTRIPHINRSEGKKNNKPGFPMSRENLQIIKEILEERLGADVISPENFEEGNKNVEEALKEEENNL